jgi:hypothetical protein
MARHELIAAALREEVIGVKRCATATRGSPRAPKNVSIAAQIF